MVAGVGSGAELSWGSRHFSKLMGLKKRKNLV